MAQFFATDAFYDACILLFILFIVILLFFSSCMLLDFAASGVWVAATAAPPNAYISIKFIDMGSAAPIEIVLFIKIFVTVNAEFII